MPRRKTAEDSLEAEHEALERRRLVLTARIAGQETIVADAQARLRDLTLECSEVMSRLLRIEKAIDLLDGSDDKPAPVENVVGA